MQHFSIMRKNASNTTHIYGYECHTTHTWGIQWTLHTHGRKAHNITNTWENCIHLYSYMNEMHATLLIHGRNS